MQLCTLSTKAKRAFSTIRAAHIRNSYGKHFKRTPSNPARKKPRPEMNLFQSRPGSMPYVAFRVVKHGFLRFFPEKLSSINKYLACHPILLSFLCLLCSIRKCSFAVSLGEISTSLLQGPNTTLFCKPNC